MSVRQHVKQFRLPHAACAGLLLSFGRSHGKAKAAMSSNFGCAYCITLLGWGGEPVGLSRTYCAGADTQVCCVCASKTTLCVPLFWKHVSECFVGARVGSHGPPVGARSGQWHRCGACSYVCRLVGLSAKSGRHRRLRVIVCSQEMSNSSSSHLLQRCSRRILRRAHRKRSRAFLQ